MIAHPTTATFPFSFSVCMLQMFLLLFLFVCFLTVVQRLPLLHFPHPTLPYPTLPPLSPPYLLFTWQSIPDISRHLSKRVNRDRCADCHAILLFNNCFQLRNVRGCYQQWEVPILEPCFNTYGAKKIQVCLISSVL